MIYKARDIFISKDFTKEELSKIFTIANGRLVDFSQPGNFQRCDITPHLIKYAKGENWKHELPITYRRFYQILAIKRRNYNQEQVLYWQQQGLTLRELAILFKVSIPSITKTIKGENNDKI